MELTKSQVEALAPDESARKAGYKIASAPWNSIGNSERAVWGEISGSGKTPYQVIVDLTNFAYKCSCPSRKLPCKHVLGLLLRFAEQTSTTVDAEPSYVAEWLDKREARAKKAAAKASTEGATDDGSTDDSSEAPVKKTPKKAAKKSAAKDKRAESVAEGFVQLKEWLCGLVRVGLGNIESNIWTEESKRLIDAKAPGVAAMIASCDSIDRTTEEGLATLLGRLGRIALLVEAYNNIDKAPADFAEEIRQLIGWTVKREDVLQVGERVEDRWVSIGQTTRPSGRLQERRSWFYGFESKRFALNLQYATRNGVFGEDFPTTSIRVERAARFYPGVTKTRAVWEPIDAPLASLSAVDYENAILPPELGDTLEGLLKAAAAGRAKFPWLTETPGFVRDVVVRALPRKERVKDGPNCQIVDLNGNMLPGLVEGDDNSVWRFVASSYDAAYTLFGEWDGEVFRPFSAWRDGKLIAHVKFSWAN